MSELRSEEIYEAALDPEASTQLAGLLASACGGRSAVLSWRHVDGDADILSHCNLSPEMMADYEETYFRQDLWSLQAMRPVFQNRVLSDEDIVSERRFSSSSFYNDFIRYHGETISHVLGGAQTSRDGSGLIGVYRNRGDPPFSEADKSLLTGVIRHLRSALILRGRLAAERRRASVSRAAWNAVPLACIVVQRHGAILDCNDVAEVVLRRGDGLQAVSGKLRTAGHARRGDLLRAVGLATEPRAPACSSLRVETSDTTYVLSVTPLRRVSGEGLAMVLFKDPLASSEALQRQVRDVWGLTPHEAAVAAELAEGCSIALIAAHRGVLETTVKSQLKAISGKLGVRGQTEMIAMMRSLP